MRPLSLIWRMTFGVGEWMGDSYPADPMIDLAKADDAVNLFKKGKKLDLKFQIRNQGSIKNGLAYSSAREIREGA